MGAEGEMFVGVIFLGHETCFSLSSCAWCFFLLGNSLTVHGFFKTFHTQDLGNT